MVRLDRCAGSKASPLVDPMPQEWPADCCKTDTMAVAGDGMAPPYQSPQRAPVDAAPDTFNHLEALLIGVASQLAQKRTCQPSATIAGMHAYQHGTGGPRAVTLANAQPRDSYQASVRRANHPHPEAGCFTGGAFTDELQSTLMGKRLGVGIVFVQQQIFELKTFNELSVGCPRGIEMFKAEALR